MYGLHFLLLSNSPNIQSLLIEAVLCTPARKSDAGMSDPGEFRREGSQNTFSWFKRTLETDVSQPSKGKD
jgi:hypothetical protein